MLSVGMLLVFDCWRFGLSYLLRVCVVVIVFVIIVGKCWLYCLLFSYLFGCDCVRLVCLVGNWFCYFGCADLLIC